MASRCCGVLTTWRADDVRDPVPLATFRFLEAFAEIWTLAVVHLQGGPSPSCEEPCSSSAAVRVAEVIITFLREANIEDRQIDRARHGHCEESEERGKRAVTSGAPS